MGRNGSGPTTAATVGEARKSDQLDSKIDSENTKSANPNQAQLISAIKAHIAKGDKAAEKSEQHYIAAGQHLKKLKKDHAGNWAEWEELLKAKIGIGKSRASELMQIADGRKTVEDTRADTNKRKIEHRKSSPFRNGEDAADPDPSAEAMKAAYATAETEDQKAAADTEAAAEEPNEFERLASKLIELDRDTAQALQNLLLKGSDDAYRRFVTALISGLWLGKR